VSHVYYCAKCRSELKCAGPSGFGVQCPAHSPGYDSANALCAACAPVDNDRLRVERDQLARAVTALGLRACDAHAAVYRAMRAGPAEAHAACQDGGYLHEAVHACLPAQALPDGVPALAARLDDEVRRHIDTLGERALRAEADRDAYRAALAGATAERDLLQRQRDEVAASKSAASSAALAKGIAVGKQSAELARSVLAAERDIAIARAKAAEAERDQYRDATTWEVTCLSCAGLLTKLRAQEERADRAEAEAPKGAKEGGAS
jgi:hypothetical protein